MAELGLAETRLNYPQEETSVTFKDIYALKFSSNLNKILNII